jgi:hypothetical protein
MGLTGIVVHLINRRARRKLRLTAPPGSIAAIVSLTSRSGFGDLLLPYDDQESIKRKLAGLKFGLDPRTGAIVADDDGTGPVKLGGPDDPSANLLDHRRLSSSTIAITADSHGKPEGLSQLYSSHEKMETLPELDEVYNSHGRMGRLVEPYNPYDSPQKSG